MEKINLRADEYNSVYSRLAQLHKSQANTIMSLILQVKGVVQVSGVFQTEKVSQMVADVLDIATNDICEPYKNSSLELEHTLEAMILEMTANDEEWG